MADKLPKEKVLALRNEIQMSMALNKNHLEPGIREGLHRYLGIHIPEIGTGWDLRLNEVYPIIQNELPSIFFRNPRAFLKPRSKYYIAKRRDPISGKMVETQLPSEKSAKTQEAILNYSLTQMKYKQEVRKVLLDALLFPHGILWHGYKGNFGMTEEQSIFIQDDQVFVSRISPLRFIKDPAVSMSNLDEAKWVGRIIDVPIQDLLEDDKLNVNKKLIKGFKGFGEKLSPNQPTSDLLGNTPGDFVKTFNSDTKTLLDVTDNEFQRSKDAKFVRVYEIYMRPTKKEKRNGSKGKIILLTEEQPEPLRENEWTIKAEGFPAIPLIFNDIPDTMFGLADIEVYKSVADQKNIIANLQVRNAQENSKVWVGISKEGADEDDIEAIQKGDNTIITFDSGKPSDRMFVASPGAAASSELYLIDQRIQRNLEDKSGVTDLKRGFLQSGEESATSVKIRNAGGGARPAYRQDLMADFLTFSMTYINQLNRQFRNVDDAVRIVGSLDIDWVDNISKEELQAEVDVEIDAISMLPENPERELQQYNTILQLIGQAMTKPELIQKIQQEGKTFNLSPLIEQILYRAKIRDPEVFRNIKPEESEGFVSVSEVRAAKANVEAALQGQPIPAPPTPNDDHRARLEVYTSMAGLLQKMGQVSDALNELIQVQSALLQAVQEKQGQSGQQIKLPKGGVNVV